MRSRKDIDKTLAAERARLEAERARRPAPPLRPPEPEARDPTEIDALLAAERLRLEAPRASPRLAAPPTTSPAERAARYDALPSLHHPGVRALASSLRESVAQDQGTPHLQGVIYHTPLPAPLAAREVDAAEGELGIRFPADYRELLETIGDGALGGRALQERLADFRSRPAEARSAGGLERVSEPGSLLELLGGPTTRDPQTGDPLVSGEGAAAHLEPGRPLGVAHAAWSETYAEEHSPCLLLELPTPGSQGESFRLLVDTKGFGHVWFDPGEDAGGLLPLFAEGQPLSFDAWLTRDYS